MRDEREGLGRTPAFLYMSVQKLTLAALLCVAVLGLAAAHASAAAYHAYVCRVPYGPSAGKPAPAEATIYTQNSATTSASESCATGGAMTAEIDGRTAHQQGQGASITYSAPDGLTIAGFRIWRHEAVGPTSADGSGVPFTKATYGSAGTLVESDCSRGVGCVERGTPSSPLDAANEVAASNLSGVTELRWNAFCGGVAGATCPANGAVHSAVYDVFAADVLLNDAAPPAASNVGGPLLAGGTLAGAQSVTFAATDHGSGVYKGALVVDGVVVTETVLDSVGGACAEFGAAPDGLPAYLNTRPCRAAVDGLLTLNTDLLPPGSHDLAVRISDAAGNQTVVRTATITVVGARPAGTPNGTGASRFAKLTARFGARGSQVRRLGFRTRPTITGRLVDEHGTPIAAATVDIVVRERRAGAPTTRIATATTGADGSFRLQLPSGPSRTVTVQYAAFSGEPKPSAAVRLSARVRAGVSARFTPRSPRLGQRVRLSGRLRDLPRASVLVRIQAFNPRLHRWQTVDTVKTGADGRYRWTYRFLAGSSPGQTFRFRVKVDSPIYPFAPGTSPRITVHVR
ncbi:MAG: hypothetical protein QOJ85_3639 [Solirubrobacteraceae bacterium]|nr:hypothetical protein [Solirubrobacteraceae bacterium]